MQKLILKYLAGEVKKKDIEQLTTWLDESRGNQAEFLRIKKIWIESGNAFSKDEGKNVMAFDEFRERIEESRRDDKINISQNDQKPWIKMLKYAAAILLLVGASGLFFFLGERSSLGQEIDYCLVDVPNGGKSVVTLPDGTKIWLNAGSKLKYNKNFGAKTREVYLEGEAYFDVYKQEIPFLIHTTHVNFQVLGTRFNINSYPDNDRIEATLVSGSLKVIGENREGYERREVLLKPDEKFTFYKNENALAVAKVRAKELEEQRNELVTKLQPIALARTAFLNKDINTQEEISWVEGDMVFTGVSLEELTRKLERKYDVEFVYKNEELKSYSYSGTIKDFTIEQVLKALSLTSPIKYTVDQKTVTLKLNKKYKIDYKKD